MVFILGVNFHEMKLVQVRTSTTLGRRRSAPSLPSFIHSLTPTQKALQRFYAIGPQTSARILAKFSIHPRAKIGSLPAKTITSLTAELSNMTIENDARRIVQDNIKRLRDMGTYRGKRHAMNLPTRGQKTRNQIMTARKLNRVERTG
ncbi:small subunit ribosomal protein S13 [Sporothrix brasiliensis 5110]|uniref:Small subunit ribosomal protein S13 n=1 Tax=Sporothrix brasiliensis 5110 TaxID=1398154 RepID=A0A0C2IH45_9PEZI|nr:small subunit ribosomal protein S13 [Sporothrix brasiliensis 5110]KIH88536.1 small subunit ribosomal protein S13 [Sporothrix brasiliensis 5110]